MLFGFNECHFLSLSLSLGTHEVEVALDRMIDRCRSGAQRSKASVEELASILAFTDKQTAVRVCGLYSKVCSFLCVYIQD